VKDKTDLPVSAVRGNTIFARGYAAGVYRLDTISYDFLVDAKKMAWHDRLFWWMLKSEVNAFSIYRVCRSYPVETYADDAINLLDERYADRRRFEGLLEQHTEHLKSISAFTPEVYVVVELESRSKIPLRKMMSGSSLRDSDQNALDTLSTYLPARRATTLEIQWLLRRAGVRGVTEPDVDPYWSPPELSLDGGVWSPGRADIQEFSATVSERGRHVEVEGDDGESVQSFLTFGALPTSMAFPGEAELMFAPLEKLNFPVDAVAHVRVVDNKSMQNKADNAVRDADDELEDASERYVPKSVHRRAQRSSFVQDYYSSEPYPPGLEVCMSLAVGAPDHKTLEDRIKKIKKRAYGSLNLHRSHALQNHLYGDHMIRPDGAQVRDYKRLMTCEQLAATMPIGSRGAGSDHGFYIAHLIPGARRLVRFNMMESSQTNRGGLVLMSGALGAGKTMAAQLLMYLAALRGSLIVDIDPRPDHSLELLLGDMVHPISLSASDNHRGRLDPLVVAPPELREEEAVWYLMSIIPEPERAWRSEVLAAVRDEIRESPHASSLGVIERLLSGNEKAKDVGRELAMWADTGVCKLAFGEGDHVQVEAERSVTTIKVSGLSLPPAGVQRASYGHPEQLAVATLRLIVTYAMRLVSNDASRHKVLCLDEAHILAGTDDGGRFLQRLTRMTRSMNVTMLALSQLLGDHDQIAELATSRFSFRQETDEQSRRNLAIHGLEPMENLVEKLRNFSDGECLMSGLDRRVAAVKFDVVDPEFLRKADTNPTRTIEALEQAIG
jgi:hypothetical protein